MEKILIIIAILLGNTFTTPESGTSNTECNQPNTTEQSNLDTGGEDGQTPPEDDDED